ncbi:MAG: LptF/LptG family permease [Acidobacteria bacterium]|nr:LptF/LptG family permease [Acidobacteriota bacterium]
MLRLIDRYVLKEAVVPTLLGLLVFTFILQIPPVMEVAEKLVAKGVPWPVIARIMATLLPQALGITIPMALLVGLLVALGRLSADRETVALQACGVSVWSLLRPVAVLAAIGWAATSWVLIVAMPRANQDYREIIYSIVAARAESEVKPRVFFEDFPNLVLYVRDTAQDGRGWRDVFLADTRKVNQPEVFVAARAHLVLDREARRVDMVLENGTRHRATPDDTSKYEVQRFASMTLGLDPEAVFPRSGLQKGDNELTLADLRAEIARRAEQNLPFHNQVMTIQKKFSIPVACLVFAVLALGLGASNRKDGKQSSFVVAIGVIFVYYIFMYTGESMAKAKWIPAEVAMWIPNIILGTSGVLLLVVRNRFGDLGNGIAIPIPRFRRRAAAAPPGSPAGQAGSQAVARQAAARPPVVVLRVPQLDLPRPRLLDIYMAKHYNQYFLLAFAGMLGIFYIATFIDLSDKLFKGQATTSMLLEYFYYSTPQYVYYVTPIAALVATLVAVGLLTKNSELIVMRACGVSLYRSALPLVVFGLFWSAMLFGLQETILAQANRRAQALNHVIRGNSARTFDVVNRQWIVGRDGRMYHYAYLDPRRREMNHLSVFTFETSPWRLAEQQFVTLATAGPEAEWTGLKGWIRTFDRQARVRKYQPFAQGPVVIEPLTYFYTEQPDAERMSYRQLRRYVDDLETSGFNAVPHAVALQRKVSFPFVTVIMTLIAVPFAVTTGRRGALYGVGAGIVLALGYWLLFSLFAAIGTAGLISATLAAWAPNILFTAGALYLIMTVRT